MLKELLLFVFFASLLAPIATSESYTDVTVQEAKAMIDSNPSLVILDVRTQGEYDSGHIRNARLVPVGELQGRLVELNKTDSILVYCRTGERSSNASQILVDNGFLYVYNMIGGITSWVNAGYSAYVKYSSIQEAINNAIHGSSVLVSSGMYYEHLVVNKSISLIGENENTTFVDGNFTGNVLNVTTSNVTVSGFTIQKSGLNDSNCGMYVNGRVADINVSRNIVKENYVGILVFNSTSCIIAGNAVFSNYDDGIRLKLCTDIVVSGNIISSNLFYGINLHDSNRNAVLSNSVSNNTYGFCANRNSDNNIVSRNSFLSSDYSAIGVYWYSDNNTVSGNTVNANYIGIDVEWVSVNNSFLCNTVSNNAYGVWLSRSGGNLFLHNSFAENAQKGYSFDSTSIFDDGLEGNYWSGYSGVDLNQNGIGDTPYVLSMGNVDDFPLMGAFQSFNTSAGYAVDVVSNSTIVEFQFFEPNRTIEMHVSNMTTTQAFGFCRMRVPHALMNQTYHITVDGADPFFVNYTMYDDGNSRWIYFSYRHSTLKIVMTPEFPSLIILTLFMVTVLLVCLIHKRRLMQLRARSVFRMSALCS
jgi:parallel beta-helix repeat protein